MVLGVTSKTLFGFRQKTSNTPTMKQIHAYHLNDAYEICLYMIITITWGFVESLLRAAKGYD